MRDSELSGNAFEEKGAACDVGKLQRGRSAEVVVSVENQLRPIFCVVALMQTECPGDRLWVYVGGEVGDADSLQS